MAESQRSKNGSNKNGEINGAVLLYILLEIRKLML